MISTGLRKISFQKSSSFKKIIHHFYIIFSCFQNLRIFHSNIDQNFKMDVLRGACTNHVDRILGNFDPLPPMWTLLKNSCYLVLWPSEQPPSLSIVHVVCTRPYCISSEKRSFFGFVVMLFCVAFLAQSLKRLDAR